ncbi:glycosyltransferase [Erythrobacter insulae]|uniref:Glycosyltransferase n=1 Tax=Erythrobacter insulae TaxID=2584124 RepID=A0A547PB96_9SPHN|nr:glycosyltransferase [Erythrobacter insulae]TRD11405.1 glycosyltransferase [Erythrobacter insulae]
MHDLLRVALLAAKMSPASGGIAAAVSSLAFGLDCFDDVEPRVLGTQDPEKSDAGASWGRLAQSYPIRGPSALQYSPLLPKALGESGPNVVDLQGLWTWSSKVNFDHFRRTGTPYIVTPHEMLAPWAWRNSYWKKLLFGLFVEHANLRSATALRATAEMEAVHFRKAGFRAPIAVVPNSVAIPELAPRPAATQLRRVIIVSRFHPSKGIAYLLKSWARLEKKYPGWELAIAGIDENGQEAQLNSLAADMRLERVSFVGEVYGEAKERFYGSGDLLVLPTHAENFGLVVAEALAQEVPVITTRNAPWEGLERNRCGWWIPID